MSEHGEIIMDNHRYDVTSSQSGCGQFLVNMGVLAVISAVSIGLLWVTGR